MMKRAWIYVLSCLIALVIGMASGVSYSDYRTHQEQLNLFENYPLSAFAGTLVSAHVI